MMKRNQTMSRSKKILACAMIVLFCGGVVAVTYVFRNHSTRVVNATPGTDEYLRAYGLTDEQLAEGTKTENREPFPLFSGPRTVMDPLGDVLNRAGQPSNVHAAWGDVSSATVAKNEGTQTWDVTINVGGRIPTSIPDKAQLFVYMDADGKSENNSVGNGVRASTDAEFVIQFNQEQGWYTDFRWYNPEAIFWAQNKETTSTFAVTDTSFEMHIPFTEVSGDQAPVWRIVLAVSSGNEVQVDVAGIAGFPAPVGETYPKIPLPEAN
jgi:hypothetical protein